MGQEINPVIYSRERWETIVYFSLANIMSSSACEKGQGSCLTFAIWN